jgi:hypothetical protein
VVVSWPLVMVSSGRQPDNEARAAARTTAARTIGYLDLTVLILPLKMLRSLI